MTDAPLGIFDSGVGGLTVARAIRDELPGESIVYLGDTARVPYGNRTGETVRRYARTATEYLVDIGIKALVVACNTASAHALGTLRSHYDLPVVGVVDPLARCAVERSTSGEIGVVGTRGTVGSGCYPAAIHDLAPDSSIEQVPSPLLVPLAEEGWTEGPVARRVATHYLETFDLPELDTLILGCTHYPILERTLDRCARKVFDREIELVDTAETTAAVVRQLLEEREALHSGADAEQMFYLTDLSPAFVETAERFFGARPGELEHVDIVG
ncbi:MAG: glutamate racemase [Bradymonadaceae bacterium]